MSEKNNSQALLPNGFADVLPPYAEAEARSIRTLMDVFGAYGYQRVKPPLLEFESSLLAPGPGAAISSETFRIMDPISHRMLGVRSDITPQVSRIVHSRLLNAPRPLRLMYANDVLRTTGSQLRTERQFTQVGCELIDYRDSVEADIEICVLSVLGLKAVGVDDITIDMTLPGFVKGVLDQVDADVDFLEKAVHQRDRDALVLLDIELAQILVHVMDAKGDASEILERLSMIDALEGGCTRLKAVYAGVQEALQDLGFDDVSLSVDILEQKGFEYHKNFAFTLFSPHVHGELGRGGCYDVVFGGEPRLEGRTNVAKGFTLYMDTVSRVLKTQDEGDVLFAPVGTPWAVVRDVQAKGYKVLRGTHVDDSVPARCTHILRGNDVLEI